MMGVGFSEIGPRIMDQHRRPLRCVIVDSDIAVRGVIRLALADCDVVAERFASSSDVVDACDRRATDILFFEPDLCGFDPGDALDALGAIGFRGAVLLVSGSHASLNEIKRAGEQRGLTMLPPLRKPFRASDIQRIAADCRRRALAACVA
jgi:FixJ family two-component response regulator